jgi:hypothetical protein
MGKHNNHVPSIAINAGLFGAVIYLLEYSSEKHPDLIDENGH